MMMPLSASRPALRLHLFLVLLVFSPEALSQTLPPYDRHEFTLPPDSEQLILLHGNHDRLTDLLLVRNGQMALYLQHPDRGFDWTTPDDTLQLPGQAAGWDIRQHTERRQEAASILALVDGQRVLQWSIHGGHFSGAHTLLEDLDALSGPGIHPLQLSQDIDGDGLDDLVIPRSGEVELHIRNADGSHQPAIPVLSDFRIRRTLDTGRRVDRTVNQSIRIPLMQLRDINGDGHNDLYVDSEQRLDIFLAHESGDASGKNRFRHQPDMSIDRLEIRERLGEFDIDNLDMNNLTGVLALTHEELFRDMNGDGIQDAILREGGRVALHLGTPDGIDLETPDQILRSSGNVMTVFLHDEDGGDQPDLWLWRIEQVSVGDVFLWLALSGSIDVNAFIYANEGDRFSRRPHRRITVTLRFPAALRMLGSVRDIRERARQSEAVIPAERTELGGDRTLQDLVVLRQEQLQVFMDALEPEQPPDEDRFLASIDYRPDRDDYEINLQQMISEFELSINEDVSRMGDRAPDFRMDLDDDTSRGDLFVTDLNNDDRDDLFVLTSHTNEAINGMLFLSTEESP